MKNIIPILFTFLLMHISIESKSHNTIISKETNLVYDSTPHIISKGDIPFREKFKLFPFNEFEDKKRTEYLYKLLNEAKKEKDTQYMIKIYCELYDSFSDKDQKKEYLDSAYTLVNKTQDNESLGLIHYKLGSYYSKETNQYEFEKTAHEFLYKAISYFEKTTNSQHLIVRTYSLISTLYTGRFDLETSKIILDKMFAEIPRIQEPHVEPSLVDIYMTASVYYSTLKMSLLEPALMPQDTIRHNMYIDSAVYYRREAIAICEKQKTRSTNSSIYDRHLANNYIDLAIELTNIRDIKDWSEITGYLEKGKNNLDSTNNIGWINYYLTKGRIYYWQEDLESAGKEYLKAEEILENNKENIHNIEAQYLRLYKQLVVINGKLGKYDNALVYQIMYTNVQEKYLNVKRYETVRELETKYETAKKELEISELNEEKKALTYERTLLIIAVIFVVILLLLLALYLRVKRLQQEKQAAVMNSRIEQKKKEYQSLQLESEANRMRSYIDGLEVERDRLSKDLHDDVSNELVAIKLQVENNGSRSELINSLNKLHTNVRHISHGLIPPIFEHVSLKEVLEDYLMQLNSKIGIKLSTKIDEKANWQSIPERISIEAYRIVQEAVGNAIKHSKASEIRIEAKYSDSNLEILIQDNGIGFNPKDNFSGLGIKILRERVTLVNGNLTIESSQNVGTRINVSINSDS